MGGTEPITQRYCVHQQDRQAGLALGRQITFPVFDYIKLTGRQCDKLPANLISHQDHSIHLSRDRQCLGQQQL